MNIEEVAVTFVVSQKNPKWGTLYSVATKIFFFNFHF